MIKNETISGLLAKGRPIRSIEFFPPRDETQWDQFHATARELLAIEPDFVSVTYGAGGSTRERTAEAARFLKDDLGLMVMPHLTCVGAGREEIRATIREFYQGGFRNIMALRGDPPKGEDTFVCAGDGLRYGADLVSLIKETHPDICTGVGGYPEKHPEAKDMRSDLLNLRAKVNNGANFITTQLFFDNEHYFRFVKECRALGIHAPIVPGLMPVLSYKQICRFTRMCGATLPPALMERLEKSQDQPEKVEEIGVEWAARQIDDLLRRGAPGFHLYVLNRSRPALALARAVGELARNGQKQKAGSDSPQAV